MVKAPSEIAPRRISFAVTQMSATNSNKVADCMKKRMVSRNQRNRREAFISSARKKEMNLRSYTALAKARMRSALEIASISRPVEVETSSDKALESTTQRRARANTTLRYRAVQIKRLTA